jgi:hypothetical protein
MKPTYGRVVRALGLIATKGRNKMTEDCSAHAEPEDAWFFAES